MIRNFCDGKFLDLNQTWNTQVPRFSPCFEDVVCTSAPFIFFFLILSLNLFRLPKHNPLPWRFRNILKMMLSVLLLSISTVWLGVLLYKKYSLYHAVPISALLAASSRVSVFLIVTLVMKKHQLRGVITSASLDWFWMVSSFCGIILYRTNFLDEFHYKLGDPEYVIFLLNMLYYPSIFINLFLAFFADTRLISPLRDKNIMDDLSIFADFSYMWFLKIIILGKKRLLTVQDLSFWRICITPQYCYARLAKYFKHYLSDDLRPNPSLGFALCKAFCPLISTMIFFDIAAVVTSIIPPLFLDRIIDFTHDDFYTWRGYFFAASIFVVDLLSKNLDNICTHYMSMTTIQLQESLMSAIFRKNLRLSTSARRNYDSGALMNLMSVDVKRLQWLGLPMCNLITAPLKIILVVYIMWQYLGIATLAGIGMILIMFPISYVMSRFGEKFTDEQMKIKDVRQKHMNEVLSGIKILKLYAWELPFSSKVIAARKIELKWIAYMLLAYVITSFIYFCAPFMISLATFATYLTIDKNHVLDATKAFVSLTLMDQLKSALFQLPDAISDLVQVNVSLRRLRKYFRSENMDEFVVGNNPDFGDAVTMRNASLSWSADAAPTLSDITLHVPEGKLVAVIGCVGAGKSSLISGIMGAMYKKSGFIDAKGNMAYVSQTPWILNRTLKENVLLVKHLDENKYNKVLDLCCLRPDLDILPGGDKTEIGDKGVNLSGGQKLRISLAQAVYQDKDVYLLDDPLSAVDVHVGKALFKDVIGNKGLLKRKTRIMVTHSVTLLPEVDLIVSMKDGRIDQMGTYDQLMRQDGSFKAFLQEHSNVKEEDQPEKNLLRLRSHDSTSSAGDADHLQRALSINADEKEFEEDSDRHRLTEDENMEVGGVHRLIYWSYVKRMGIPVFLASVFWYIMYVGFQTGASLWVADWTADVHHNSSAYTYYRLEVYGSIGVGQVLSIILASAFLVMASKRASLSFHNDMLHSVLRSPMRFFDSTPTGRVLNRFTTDLDTIDIQLFYRVDGWLNSFFSTIFSFGVIGVNVPVSVVIMIPLGIIYYNLQRLHLNTIRQIRRLESTNRSPIYSLFLESIQGVSSISAYKIKDDFVQSFEERLEKCFVCLSNSYICNRWLNFLLEICGSCVVLATTLSAISNRHNLNPSMVGLIVSYALSVTENLKWLVRMNSELEDKSISIERVEEYCHLEPEAEWHKPGSDLEDSWPESGNIVFDNYSTRYRENLDLVLRDVNLAIGEHEKVGIIGRTGAGKSSITLGLFRIIEPATGTIFIDNVDVAKIGLHDLRKKLTIIPQDPVLFSGPLRNNLDPNEEYTDEQLWQSLEKAHLKVFVAGLERGMHHDVEENGANLSAGQRQLVCLARALLKNTQILLMDEATASVDIETDALIQQTIRTAFKEHTVVTIAHRLNTVMDYDKIVVLDRGSVLELGSPAQLLENKSSRFHEMCKEAGLI